MSFRKDCDREGNATAIDPHIVRQLRQRTMSRLKRDEALLFFHPSNILGFVGVPLAPSDRLVCGLMNARGQTALICPAFEAPSPTALPENTIVLTWTEHEDPFQTVSNAARKLGVERGAILLDDRCWTQTQRALTAAMPETRLCDDPGIMVAARMCKSAEEVEAIARACQRVGALYAEVEKRIAPGVSEIGLAVESLAALPDGESLRALPLIQAGSNAATPHRPTGRRLLEDGDCVIVDFYAPRQGYWGDMTRTLAVGRPSDEARSAYRAVRDAHRAGIAACRPGVACEDVDRAARSVIENAGLGEYFIHRLGHGIGLDGHEPPYLVRGNRMPLEAGMCVTVEPGVYVPQQFGIRIEDVVVVTEDGCRVLSGEVPVDLSPVFDG